MGGHRGDAAAESPAAQHTPPGGRPGAKGASQGRVGVRARSPPCARQGPALARGLHRPPSYRLIAPLRIASETDWSLITC